MNIIEYPKINTIWKRESEKPRRIMIGAYSKPEFETVNRWHVTEKIDGTNVRVIWDGEHIEFRGRTDRANMPTKLMLHLQQTFTPEKMKEKFSAPVLLFGEGYGAGIQKGGGNYCADQRFILFDVLIDGWWLEPENVKGIAQALEIPSVPVFGCMSTDDAIDLIAFNLETLISELAATPHAAEGIVCRSAPALLNRKGERVMWKLKLKDYAALGKSNA